MTGMGRIQYGQKRRIIASDRSTGRIGGGDQGYHRHSDSNINIGDDDDRSGMR